MNTQEQTLIEFPELRRFMLIGGLNVAIFYGLYEGMYYLSAGLEHRAAMSWIIAYSMGSIVAHTTHRLFTFRSSVPIEHSLPTAVAIYGSTLILSTFSEVVLIEILGWHHRLAWLFNASIFGILIYILLRHFAFPTRLSEDE
tara:strand:+ start:247 stop:672 length:426 start_codon:yes stop_codon:yes gene_type:complete